MHTYIYLYTCYINVWAYNVTHTYIYTYIINLDAILYHLYIPIDPNTSCEVTRHPLKSYSTTIPKKVLGS